MGDVSGFRSKALEGKSNRDWLNDYVKSGGNTIKTCKAEALEQNKETADDVDRSDSGSGTSTIEKVATVATVLTTLAGGFATVYGALKGNKSSSNGNAGGNANAGAQQKDPLVALSQATSAYQSNQSKANLQNLTGAIATATIQRNSIKNAITEKTANLENYTKMYNNGQTNYELCKDHLTKLSESVNSQYAIITDSQTKIDKNQSLIDNFEKSLTQQKENKAANAEAKANQQGNVEQSKSDVSNADASLTSATANQTAVQTEQDKYKADYQNERAKTAELTNNKTTADADLKKASSALDSANTKVDGLKAQIKSSKEKKQDVSSLDEQLKEAEAEQKNAEKALKDAKKAAESAQKELTKNQENIAKLESKIQVGDTTLANAKTEVENAKKAKETAEKTLNTAASELRGFIDEDKVFDQNIKDTAAKKADANEQDAYLNTQLAKAMSTKEILISNVFSAENAAKTLKSQIDNIKDSVSKDTKEQKSLQTQLNEYDKAIKTAEEVRNGNFAAELQTGGDVYADAKKLGYTGDVPSGATGLTKNKDGDFEFTLSNGSKKVVKADKKDENPKADGVNPNGAGKAEKPAETDNADGKNKPAETEKTATSGTGKTDGKADANEIDQDATRKKLEVLCKGHNVPKGKIEYFDEASGNVTINGVKYNIKEGYCKPL